MLSLHYGPTLASVHDYWEKKTALTIQSFVSKWCLCFLICCVGLSSRFFQEASFNFMVAVTICSDFQAQEKEICHRFHLFSIYLPWSDGTICHHLSILILSFKLAFSLSSFTITKRLYSSSSLVPLEWYHLHIWSCWYFPQQSCFQLVTHLARHFTWHALCISYITGWK